VAAVQLTGLKTSGEMPVAGLTNEFAQVQNLTAYGDVRKQDLDKGMLAVGRGTLAFRAHDTFNRCKVQLAERVVLTAEQALSSSQVLGTRPRRPSPCGLERFDRLNSISGKKP
jgi:hypothetical protein